MAGQIEDRAGESGAVDVGALWLATLGITWLLGGVLASTVGDSDLTFPIMLSLICGPTLFLLVRGGSRDDGRAPSGGFERRSRALLVSAGLLMVLALVAAATGNSSWIITFWLGALGVALAKIWGAFQGPRTGPARGR
jgi:hypothetical protein